VVPVSTTTQYRDNGKLAPTRITSQPSRAEPSRADFLHEYDGLTSRLDLTDVKQMGPCVGIVPYELTCGLADRMLQYFASKGVVQDNGLKTLTKRLLNKNPRLRPLLGVQSSVTVAHPLNNWNSILKRNLDTLPHDAKRLAIFTGLTGQ
jgi:hypothetical protein